MQKCETYLLRLDSSCGEMSTVLKHLAEKGPPMTEGGIGGLTRNLLMNHTEISVIRIELRKQPPESVSHLIKHCSHKTYCISSGASRHPEGKFFPSWGQAGHSTVNSHSFVPIAHRVSCPQPARLSILRLRHSWIIHKNSSYRSWLINQ
jgi:hypothetical protein